MDALYKEYDLNGFHDITFSDQDQQDPAMAELISYVEAVKASHAKLDDIPTEVRQKLADYITRE